jgi:6-pyruvoyltetrahydropterin/6-carboxytetrahydropterin synthase
MFEVGVQGVFSAAHRLDGYPGSCASFHGHNWDVEVFVRGEALDETGLLVDFRMLKSRVREILEAVDHRDLNRLPEFRAVNPTSENLARYLYAALSKSLNCDRHRVHRVSVRETRGTVATYWE